MLRVEELTDNAAIEALAPEWADLWSRCPGSTPFQHSAWLLPWWRRLWGGGTPWWLALRDGSRLAGLAPLFIWGHERRCVSLVGTGVTDYLDFLIEPEYETTGATLIIDLLSRCGSRWDLCDFQELREASPIPAAASRLPGAVCEPSSVCPVLSFPQHWDELQAVLPQKFRTDLRRAGNRVRTGGGSCALAGPQDLDEVLEALFRLHAARWSERGEEGVMSTPTPQSFYAEAARQLLDAGMLRLGVLRIDGCIAAALFGFAANGRFYAYLDGFDPALAKLSPGTVLMGWLVQQAIDEGLREFDFLRDPEPYKYLWGARDRANRRVVLQS